MPDFPTPVDKEQCVKYAAEIRQICSYLLDSGLTTKKEMAHQAEIKFEHTLAQFFNRPPEKHKYSDTLLALYRYIIHSLDHEVVRGDKETHANLSKILISRRNIDSYAPILFHGLIDYLGSSLDAISDVGVMCRGVLYVYRNSVLENRIVKTKLSIFSDEKISQMWRFNQLYKDSMGNLRQSSGILSVNVGNVYCMGRVVGNKGLDIVVFKEPSSKNRYVVQGLVLTMDTNFQPLVAKAIIRFSEEDADENIGSYGYEEISSEIGDFLKFLHEEKAISIDIV